LSRINNFVRLLVTNAQMKLIVLITMILFIMLIVASTFFYYTTKSIVLKEAAEPQLHLLRIGMESVDATIKGVDQIAINVLLTPSVLGFLNPEKASTYDDNKKLVEYLGNVAVSPHIKNILIYDPFRHRMASSYYGFSSSLEDLFAPSWEEMIPKKLQGMTVRQVELRLNNGSTRTEYMLFRPIFVNNEFAGIIMIVLDQSSLFANVYDNQTDDAVIDRFVLNNENRVIRTISGNGVIGSEVIDLIQAKRTSTFEYKDRKITYLIAQLRSEYVGWTFGAMIPQKELLHPLNRIRTILFGLSLVSIAGGVSGLVYFYYMSFRPFRRITKLLHKYENSQNFDAQQFTRLVERLYSEADKLSHALQQGKKELNAKYIVDYLHNKVSAWESKERWQRLFQSWDRSSMLLVIFSIDHYDAWAAKNSDSDILLLKYAMKNVAEETFSASYRVMLVDYESDLLMIIQPSAGSPIDDDSLEETVRQYIQLVDSLINISMSAAIGEPFSSAAEFKTVYFNAEYALCFRLYLGYQQVIRACKLETSHPQSLNEGLASGLLESLESGRVEMALYYLGEIQTFLKSNPIDPVQALEFFDQVMMSITLLYEHNEVKLSHDLQSYHRKQFYSCDLDEVFKQIYALIHQARDMSEARTVRREYVLAIQIVDFLKENIANNIGIQEISSRFNMSRSAVHVLFKKEMNISVYEYLTKLRMELAKDLLQSTHLKITEIAARTGYLNDNSFIRSFRKVYHLTPGQYRNMQRRSPPE